jgi:hypothetical protein
MQKLVRKEQKGREKDWQKPTQNNDKEEQKKNKRNRLQENRKQNLWLVFFSFLPF